MRNNNILIIPEIYGSRYFIFRTNGQEISFNIKDGKPNPSKPLTKEELIFIYENIR